MELRLELFVKDLRKAARFYTEVLGFVVGKETDDYISVKKGNAIIGLGSIEKLRKSHYLKPQNDDERIGGGVEIVLEVEEIEAYYKRILDLGYPIHAGLTVQSWGSTDFRLIDPDGYYIRITAKH